MLFVAQNDFTSFMRGSFDICLTNNTPTSRLHHFKYGQSFFGRRSRGDKKNTPHQICAQFFVVFLICLCFLAMRLLENTDLRRNPWFSWFELLSDPEGGGNATKGLFENATTEKEEDAGARDERRVRAAVSCFFSVQHRMFHVRTAFIYLVSSSDVTLHVPDCVIYGS